MLNKSHDKVSRPEAMIADVIVCLGLPTHFTPAVDDLQRLNADTSMSASQATRQRRSCWLIGEAAIRILAEGAVRRGSE